MMVMPAQEFVLPTDEDLGRIIAFLKSLPAVEGPGSSVSPGPLGRIGIVTGEFKPVAELIAETDPPPEAANAEGKYGRYLARTFNRTRRQAASIWRAPVAARRLT